MKIQNSIARHMAASILMLAVGTCGATEIYSAKFRSMKACLAGIKKGTGKKMEIIRDTPTIVTGSLGEKETFACELKETGSEGTYIEGWYTSP